MADLNWTPIADGCDMPKDGEEVLVTVWIIVGTPKPVISRWLWI